MKYPLVGYQKTRELRSDPVSTSPSRRKVLKSIRKRDLVEAVDRLRTSETGLCEAESHLTRLSREIETARGKLKGASNSRSVLARDLTDEQLLQERAEVRLCKLEEEQEAQLKRLGKAERAVDLMKDEVARAKRALDTVDK